MQLGVYIKERILGSSFVKDSMWSFMGNVLGRGLALLASIFIARLLGKDLFGMYGFVRSTLLTMAIFSSFGLGYTATKFVAEYLSKSPERIRSLIDDINRITLVAGTFCAVLIFLFSAEIARLLGEPELYGAIRYLAVIVVFNSVTTTQIGVLAGFKRYKQLARINVINGVVTFFISVVLTYFYSLNGALLALLITQVFNCLQNYIAVRRSIDALGVVCERCSISSVLLRFSTPIAMQEIVYSLSGWILTFLMVRLYDVGEVGISNAAAVWSSFILFIPGTLRNVILSYLSSDSDDPKRQVRTTNHMLLINLLATTIPFIVVWLLSDLIQLMYGASYTRLASVLILSIFATIPSCLSSVLAQYFIALNKNWLSLWIRIVRECVAIACFVLFYYIYPSIPGAISLAMTTVLVHILGFVTYYLFFLYQRPNGTERIESV